jgi:hypothetical protein
LICRQDAGSTLRFKTGRGTQKEALSKASKPQALEMNFKGIFLNEGGRIVG